MVPFTFRLFSLNCTRSNFCSNFCRFAKSENKTEFNIQTFRPRNIFKRKSCVSIYSRRASHYVGFICVAFHGRISNGTSGSWCYLLLYWPSRSTRPNGPVSFGSWSSIIWNSFRSQRFHLKFFREIQHIWNGFIWNGFIESYVMWRSPRINSNATFPFEDIPKRMWIREMWKICRTFFQTIKSNYQSGIGCNFCYEKFEFLNLRSSREVRKVRNSCNKKLQRMQLSEF